MPQNCLSEMWKEEKPLDVRCSTGVASLKLPDLCVSLNVAADSLRHYSMMLVIDKDISGTCKCALYGKMGLCKCD